MNKTKLKYLRNKSKKEISKIKEYIFKRDNHTCNICGYNPNIHGNGTVGVCIYNKIYLYPYLTIDHIIPLSKYGTNKPNNLQTLCSDCNSSKGQRVGNDFPLNRKRRRKLKILNIHPIGGLNGLD